MRRAVLLVVLTALAAVAGAQSYHPPQYLFGGYWEPPTHPGTRKGVFLADLTGAAPSIQAVFPQGQAANSFDMDVDNRHVVMALGPNPYATHGGPFAGAT